NSSLLSEKNLVVINVIKITNILSCVHADVLLVKNLLTLAKKVLSSAKGVEKQ
ncbi:6421_t:CDS:1, partial [Racocetra fulgida]